MVLAVIAPGALPSEAAEKVKASGAAVRNEAAAVQVAREVYNGCLRGALSQTTRVLVTNQLQFVSGSDRVLFVSDGRIAEAGTYTQLMKAEQGFALLMRQAEARFRSLLSSIRAVESVGVFSFERRVPSPGRPHELWTSWPHSFIS